MAGTASCAGCHQSEFSSWSTTPHAHSLEQLTADDELPDGQIAHAASGRTYEVFREHGEMWHRETLADASVKPVISSQHKVSWRIGSGNHSRSYLIVRDGYFFESPVTWYTSKNSWGMSPGFHSAHQEGFARATHIGCIQCHCGQVESIDNSDHRLRITESAIGCESCHGPGSLHVAERTQGLTVSGHFDDTIVNPAAISRHLNEDICARCHLRGAGWAFVGDRKISDYRPGLSLSDFRVDFVRKEAATGMEVVGHFEQMHASRCYTASDSMTCTTCHNPHKSPGPDEKVEYYRRACAKCHHDASSDCGLPQAERLEQSPQDDCVTCHMPKSETEIPHLTFTHHRIGINHAPQERGEQNFDLVPLGDVSRLTTLELQRCLGLALERLARTATSTQRKSVAAGALSRLSDVYRQGLRDARVLGGLAYLLWTRNDPQCVALAEQAVQSSDLDSETRIHSLIVLGDSYLQRRDFSRSENAFETLTRLRLRYTDWQMLGVCRSLQRNSPGAILAFRKAIDLQPGSADIHTLLAKELMTAGQTQAAEQHRAISDQLRQMRQRANKSH